jgi:hypothetical protein
MSSSLRRMLVPVRDAVAGRARFMSSTGHSGLGSGSKDEAESPDAAFDRASGSTTTSCAGRVHPRVVTLLSSLRGLVVGKDDGSDRPLGLGDCRRRLWLGRWLRLRFRTQLSYSFWHWLRL